MFLFANTLSEVRISDQISVFVLVGSLQNLQLRIAPVGLVIVWTRLGSG